VKLDSIKNSIKEIAVKARLRLLDLHYKANHGHIGGDFSCIDGLIVLFNTVMKEDDQFILSKGHAAGALYTALWSTGIVSEDELKTFARDATRLGIHPPVKGIDSILFGTGSLGHGPSLAAGLALGKKLKKESGRVFCLCGDGEWQEGACWEALMFATHKKLDNLTIIIDANGWQGFGSTEKVLSLGYEDLCEKLHSFGVNVIGCDGHDLSAIQKALTHPNIPGILSVVILKTVKGKGIPELEDTLASHYLPMTKEQYEQARRKTGGNNA